jgi:hypothetical protein
MNTREILIDTFWPESEGGFWSGWNGWFEPCIPGRLFGVGHKVIINAIKYPRRVDEAIEFFSNSHMKYLSQSGRGLEDVKCVPTEKAKNLVELLKRHRDYVTP